jgi:hypothetical protein
LHLRGTHAKPANVSPHLLLPSSYKSSAVNWPLMSMPVSPQDAQTVSQRRRHTLT